MRAFLAAALATCFMPGPILAQSNDGFGVELRAGAVLGSQPLGVTVGAPSGQFGFGEVDPAPVLGVGVVFPEIVLGIRPLAGVSWAPPADVAGNWTPCDPGRPCAAVLMPVEGRATRLEGTIGAQVPLLTLAAPIRPHVTAAAGFRRYGLAWEPIGGPGDFQLEGGSLAETDLLARIGLGVAIDFGRFAVLAEGAIDFSSFGPGRVPVPEESLALWPEPTIDLGRESVHEYEVVVGLRRFLR